MIGSRPAVGGVDRVAQPTYGMTAGKAHAGGRRHQFVGLRSEGVRVIVLFRTLCVFLDAVGQASSRRTRIGHLVLGSGFDRRDLLRSLDHNLVVGEPGSWKYATYHTMTLADP